MTSPTIVQEGRMAVGDDGELTCLVCGQAHQMPRDVQGREEEKVALQAASKFLKAHGEFCKMTKAVC